MRVYRQEGAVLIHGDSRTVLRALPEGKLDACITDPPYGLSFMGKGWDHGVPDADMWLEVLRVLKPGAHLLAFGGTRTFHRLAVAIEDAGFEIRDTVMWVYGSGFPKSHNLDGEWEGWGTALKPAWEPIIVARKPLVGTVAANVLAHGTGALNIDGCRISATDKTPAPVGTFVGSAIGPTGLRGERDGSADALGRWPANLIHDGSEEVVSCFPTAPGQQGKSSDSQRTRQVVYGATSDNGKEYPPRGDSGSAARFFYCAKASKADRGEGNTHPTVKPTALMQYLCRLVTPAGGTVLDPFMGSGSTGKAARIEGFKFVGIDQEEKYVAIARERVK